MSLQSIVNKAEKEIKNKSALLGILCAACAADFITTQIGIAKGGIEEVNPVARSFM